MKNLYSKHLSDESWRTRAEGWVRSLQGTRETQLALGNGLIGSRGILEEIPYDSKPGTYIAGLYDRIGSQVSELVNLPNPFNFKIAVEGERLGVVTMDAVEHKRILDMKRGILIRKTLFSDSRKRQYDYQSLRFLSAKDKNIGVMQVAVTPLDEAVKISIETGMDTSVYNAGTVTEGRKKHFRVKELGQFDNEGYLIIQTFSKEHLAIMRSGFWYEKGGKKTYAEDNVFELSLKKGERVVFTKVFYIEAFSRDEDLNKKKELTEKDFRKAFGSGFKQLLKSHVKAFESLWDIAEVSIWGNPQNEKDMRFNIYHLLICSREDNGLSSIGARALSGEGYHGHIFWDAEIFVLPFYLYTLPHVARNMLIYRYRRLGAAKEIALRHGFKGAMFPWESAGIGVDETPEWAKDLDGKIIKIHTGKRELHITADIAYAVYHYYNVTGDEEFMRDFGYELIFECARFWMSRIKYNKKRRKSGIGGVIGPDEFHENVDDSAYTNMMAKWNLLLANRLYCALRKNNRKNFSVLTEKMALSPHEAVMWKNVAARIYFEQKKDGMIEQFRGYFKLKDIRIKDYDENYLPIVPKRMTPRGYRNTQFVKQADIVMLLHLLSDVFNYKTKKRNYDYYIQRTLHKSSLSLPIHALMAAKLGDKSRAYRFFDAAMRTDISDIHGNTYEGIHAACIGGTWQALTHGFCGTGIEKECLSIDPRLPSTWRKVLFSICWRGDVIRLEAGGESVKLEYSPNGKKKKRLKIRVFGIWREISSGKPYIFKRGRKRDEKSPCYL